MKKIFLILVLLIAMKFNISVNAYEDVSDIDISGGGQSLGSNSPCIPQKNSYTACYYPRFQFRVTLVDANGKKVKDTKSVDFSHQEESVPIVYTYKYLPYKYNGTRPTLVNDNYKYAYYENDNLDDNLNDSLDDFRYVKIPMVSNINKYISSATGRDNPDYYGLFFNEFIGNVKDTNVKNIDVKKNGKKVSFLSAFAYYSNYANSRLNSDEKEEYKYDVNIDRYSKLKREIIDGNYYLLIEPTYIYFYNTTIGGSLSYRYGTAKEIMEWMSLELNDVNKLNAYISNGGYLVGLSKNFVYQTGCNLYTTVKQASDMGFVGIKDNTDCSPTGLQGLDTNDVSRVNRINWMRMVARKDNGYGQYVLRLSGTVVENNDYIDVNYDVDLCTDNQVKITRNISVRPSVETGESNLEEAQKIDSIINDAYRIGSSTGESAVYCYDDLVYDFNDIVNELSKKVDLRSGYVKLKVPELTLTVTRSCYFKSASSPTSAAKDFSHYAVRKFGNDFKIKINGFEQSYDLKFNSGQLETIKERPKNFHSGLDSSGWATYIATIKYGIENKNNAPDYLDYIYLLPNKKYQDNNIQIDFSNVPIANLLDFKENGMIKKLLNQSENKLEISLERPSKLTTYNYTYKLNFLNSGNGANGPVCSSKNNVIQNKDGGGENGGGDGDGSTPDNPPTPNDGGTMQALQFRVISLSNPFPARDGTSRLPGTNWLNNENNVYNYINNNRAIQYRAKYESLSSFVGNLSIEDKLKANPDLMYLFTKPIYKITLDPSTMLKIRNYNKGKNLSDINKNLVCSDGYRQCVSSFLRDTDIIKKENFTGECSDDKDFTKSSDAPSVNIENLLKGIDEKKYIQEYDFNRNSILDVGDSEALANWNKQTGFYTCADKTAKSGG